MSSKEAYLTIDLYRMRGSYIEDNNITSIITNYCSLVKFGLYDTVAVKVKRVFDSKCITVDDSHTYACVLWTC